MPYLEEATQSDQAHDSVFTDQPSLQLSDSIPMIHCLQVLLNHQPKEGVQEAQREHHLCIRKVYTYSTIESKMAEAPKFRQTLFVSCIPNG